ncbi:hypothetical protein M0802_013458 [Mischocyttarus mexicanus]|nr:hypothetical protein M0802_013458 [Mischocyttarus mexicanus]
MGTINDGLVKLLEMSSWDFNKQNVSLYEAVERQTVKRRRQTNGKASLSQGIFSPSETFEEEPCQEEVLVVVVEVVEVEVEVEADLSITEKIVTVTLADNTTLLASDSDLQNATDTLHYLCLPERW